MKIRRFRPTLLILLSGATLAHADILILKNGNKIEGTILDQNQQGVKMKYRLTPKIMDEKVFPVGEIDKVIKQTPQEVEVVELRKILPTMDLLKADEYEQIIQDRLRPFVNKYPGTPEAKEVEDIISKLQEEKTMVANGQVKLEGKWLSVKESKGESFNIEAFRILDSMRKKAAKSDLTGALREFDRLMIPSPAYRGSVYYLQAIPETVSVLDKWISALEKMSSEQPQLDKARKDGLDKLQEPELSKTKNAINDEIAKWRAMVEAERRQKLRWSAPYKYDISSIQSAMKEAVEERTRLQNVNMEMLKAKTDLAAACYRKIGEQDYMGGAAAFEKLQTLQNDMEFRDVVYDARSRLIKLHGELSRAIASGATATAGSSAIGGVAATGVESRVAQILAEAGAAAPSTASTSTATTQTMPQQAAAAPTQPRTAQVNTSQIVAPAAAQPAQPRVAPQAVAPVAPVQQVAPMPIPQVIPQEEESNLQLYIMIAMGVVIIVLGAAFLKQKKA